MKELTALAWKEWSEVRIYLWIAIGIFIGLPIIGGFEELFEHYVQHFEISTMPWVIMFGGVLAIFVAVGATCRDFNGHLEDFWRSRPVGVVRWLLVKYFIGLTVVLVACGLPLAIEISIDRDKSAVLPLVWYPALWAALYSVGFLSGCLLRRTAHAAMLALAAMLLVYFLPMVLPPLGWMNATTVTDSWGGSPWSWPAVWDARMFEFAVGMLGLAIGALALALVAARCGWRIESGRKMMYGSVSAAMLILFSSAGFQLGTNLPVLDQVDMPQDGQLVLLKCDGVHGTIVSMAGLPPGTKSEPVTFVDYVVRPIQLSASGIALGGSTRINGRYFWDETYGTRSAAYPEISYSIGFADAAMASHDYDTFALRAYTASFKGKEILSLWKETSSNEDWPFLWIWQGKLYVIGTHLIVLDISEPLKPRIISDTPIQYSLRWDYSGTGAERFEVPLPPVPDIPPRERLNAIMGRLNDRSFAFEGDTLCIGGDALYAYHLRDINPTAATFEKIGQYQPTILEKVFGVDNYYGMRLKDGFLYQGGGQGFPKVFNPVISIFDTRGATPMKMIGHFAAPGVQVVCPLPDGRALVGGSKLWLVGPPPRRDSR